jgi:hypothetical protein
MARSAIRSPSRALGVGLLAALAAALVPAGPAHAGEYAVTACDGRKAGTTGWQLVVKGGHKTSAGDDCDEGLSFSASLRGTGDAQPAGSVWWRFRSPAGTTISGGTLVRAMDAIGPAPVAGAEYHGYTYALGDIRYGERALHLIETCRGASECAALRTRSDAFSWTSNRPRLTRLDVGVACHDGCPATMADRPAYVRVTRALIRLNDANRPRFSLSAGQQGGLFDPDPTPGLRAFTVSASDQGGGLLDAAVEVNGAIAARYPFGGSNCRAPYVVLVPCPLQARRTFAFDTGRLPDGVHRVRILVRDVTGTNVAKSTPRSIVVSHRGRPNGSPASDSARLTAGLRRSHSRRRPRRTLIVRVGHGATLTGRLRARGGRPIAGAALDVATRDRFRPSAWRSLPPLRTSERGRFALRVRPGVSRAIRIAYRAATADVAPADAITLRLFVRPGVRVRLPRVARRGHPVRFRGRLIGRPFPATGKLVEFQARLGPRWQTFATTRASRNGRFSHRHVFRADGPATRHLIRVRVPRENGYPYAAGRSRAVRVRVF